MRIFQIHLLDSQGGLFILEPSESVVANPARHKSNWNNKYIEKFQDIVIEAHSEGYYGVNWESPSECWSDIECKNIQVAAQEACNRLVFEGLSYEMGYSIPCPVGSYLILIKFTWN